MNSISHRIVGSSLDQGFDSISESMLNSLLGSVFDSIRCSIMYSVQLFSMFNSPYYICYVLYVIDIQPNKIVVALVSS